MVGSGFEGVEVWVPVPAPRFLDIRCELKL